MRQDTALKKVYYISGAVETLLYDFSLNVGDTLPITHNNNISRPVIEIDSVLVGNEYRKRFYIEHLQDESDSVAIVEGIGSTTYGLLNPMVVPFESGSSFLCFNYNQVSYPTAYDCSYNVGIYEKTKQSFENKIFPNPASTLFYLCTTAKQVIITNLTGKTLLTIQSNYYDNSIDISQLDNGIYFIKTSDEQTNKLIINH